MKQKKNGTLDLDYDTDESTSFLRSFTVTWVSHMYDVIGRTNGWAVLLQGPPLTTLIGPCVKCPLPDWPEEALSHWLSSCSGYFENCCCCLRWRLKTKDLPSTDSLQEQDCNVIIKRKEVQIEDEDFLCQTLTFNRQV